MSNSILCCLRSQCKDLVHTDIDSNLPANESCAAGHTMPHQLCSWFARFQRPVVLGQLIEGCICGGCSVLVLIICSQRIHVLKV